MAIDHAMHMKEAAIHYHNSFVDHLDYHCVMSGL